MTTANDSNQTAAPELVFDGGFDEREAFEAEARGYRAAVHVEFPDGRKYPVVFYDAVRLQQTLEDDAKTGSPFLAEPGLIVVAEVTRSCMELAVTKLAKEHFFDALMPTLANFDNEVERCGEGHVIEMTRAASRSST